MSAIYRTSVVCGALLLGACALLDRPAESTLYAPFLVPVGRVEQGAFVAAASPRIAVDQPRSIAPFDGTRIVVEPTPGEMQFYKGARWRDAVPLMLQDLLLQALQEAPNGRAAAIGNGGKADFILRSDLRVLTAEYRGASRPTAHVRLDVQLVRRSDGDLVATHAFDEQEICRGTRLPDVFAAFQEVLNRLARDVVAWTTVSAADKNRD